MIETQVRAVFTSIAEAEPIPSRVDTELAHRRGRARLRRRRAGLAGAPLLAAAAVVAVVLAVGAVPFRTGPGPAARPQKPAPRTFSPLAPYAGFGWLPAGERVLFGATYQPLTYQFAGSGPSRYDWRLDVFSRGHCRLSAAATELTCGLGRTLPETLRIATPAPSVDGNRAYWIRPAPGWRAYLAWQYAKGGWAVLSWPGPGHVRADWHAQALKIADHVRYGAHAAPPLAFPVQLTGVPAAWRLSGVAYEPRGAVSAVSETFQSRITGHPGVGYPVNDSQPGLPEFRFGQAASRNSCLNASGGKPGRIIDGYQVFVSHPSATSSMLCAPDADGLLVQILILGHRPVLSVTSLFAHHMKLLGANPAHWARKPFG